MPKLQQADDVVIDDPQAGQEVVEEVKAREVTPSAENPGDETKPEELDGEVVVTIEGESPTPEDDNSAPEWVRSLRKNYRELQREKRELEEKLKSKETTEPNPVFLGKKPTLEDSEYDTEKYEQKLAEWYEQKRSIDEANSKRAQAQAEEQKAWQTKLNNYSEAKAKLKVPDFDDAEASVQESFNIIQQGLILQGAENPALLIYALGKNPKKAKELSELKDPVQFAFAMGKLETQLKITSRKSGTPPPPEKKVVGNAGNSSSDSTLDRLREEAARTGDFTKVVAYKRQLKQQS